MDELVGQSLRGYQIKERIGSGGYGVVYRAFQPSVDREVAIKVILPSRAKTVYFIKRFDAEARLVAKLEHPFIVPLYDYWREEESAALVMRWLPGGSLRDTLAKGPLPLKDINTMITQIGDALVLAHENKVVHRDLKPDNILVDDKDNHFLTDFGIAKDLRGIITADSTLGHVTGTPAYLSPEQGMGEKVTHRSDIYSLGVVLFELLTGEHPFPEADPTTQIIHHISDPLPSASEKRPDLPSAVDNVIEIATAKNPAGRYDSIQQFIDAFQSIAAPKSASVGEVHIPGILEKKLGVRPSSPKFLDPDALPNQTSDEIFVGRERHLKKLDEYFESAMKGNTQLVFVTGEAGRGKTALIREFAQRKEGEHDHLLIAHGGCNLYTGFSDPYLPFRQVLAMFSGDAEVQWLSGETSTAQARRLWDLMPEVCSAFVDSSPDLIDTLINSRELASRAAAFDTEGGPWQSRLADLIARKSEEGYKSDSGQNQLFHQYVQLLRRLAGSHHLLILLDDLHWIDQASLGLLVRLGQEIRSLPILIIGAFRSEEIQTRNGESHPLEAVLSEFKRQFGDILINLGESKEAEDSSFVDEYLDNMPNRLGKKFRQALTKHTHGHALFLKELLLDLQARGELVEDDQERWIVKKDITWDRLPARVEGVIEKRLERLPPEDRRILEIASVEGKRFTAEVIAGVLQRQTPQIIERLSSGMERSHQLVEDRGIERVNGSSISRYQFSHDLVQTFLYNHIGENQRVAWHEEIALRLEELYSQRSNEIASSLARHFHLALRPEKAVQYYKIAGEQARRKYALLEAISAYQHAASLHEALNDQYGLGQTLTTLGYLYHSNLDFDASQAAYSKAFDALQNITSLESRWDLTPAHRPLRLPDFISIQERMIDPAKANSENDIVAQYQLLSGLVEWDPTVGIVPALARDWELLENGRRYRFKLRNDIFWSDGHPITAHDFVYAWQRVLDPEIESTNALDFFVILNAESYFIGKSPLEDLGVRAIDDQTLEVKLEKPIGYFLHLLSLPGFFAVPMHVVKRHSGSWTEFGKFVSSGPFLWEAPHEGVSFQLRRNPSYRGNFPGNLELIHFHSSGGDPEDILEKFADDLFDEINLRIFSPDQIIEIIRNWPADYLTYFDYTVHYLVFRHDNPPFDDIRVRRAFAHATDKRKLANVVLHGLHTPALGGLVPPGIPGHSEHLSLPFDPMKARKLLREAGFENGDGFPPVRLLSSKASKLFTSILVYFQNEWLHHLGIKIEHIELPRIADASNAWNEGKGDFRSLSWTFDYPDPQNILSPERLSSFGLNSWKDETYLDAISKAEASLDPVERIRQYQIAEKILIDQVVIIPINYLRSHLLRKPWIKSAKYGIPRMYWPKDLVIEPH